MGRWLLLQIGRAVLAAWATASIIFILSRITAGAVENSMLGEPDDLQAVGVDAAPGTTPGDVRRALTQRLGLDEPIFYITRTAPSAAAWHWHGTHNQYHHWLVGLLHGQLGVSFRDGQPIGPRLRAALSYTFPLTAAAAIIATFSALGLGLALADGPLPGRTTGWRALVHALLTSVQSLPVFTLALGLLFLFANPDLLNILPAFSASSNTSLVSLGTYLSELVLPLVALVLAVLPELTLPLVASLHHELRADYATTAKAKGATTSQLLRRHVLPNAVLPLLTSLAGLLPTLLAGTVVVEMVFALPGTGRLLAEAAASHDYPVVVAGVLLIAAARLLSLALADALYSLFDPRIRLAS
ncbi:MAG: ABC transporter permease [Hymenobacter sp.]|nr:MAG: ABC transporter permease [Hymenobacter sp.]